MITLTAEQAQQIEGALEDIIRVFQFETGTPVEALAVFRAARSKSVEVHSNTDNPEEPLLVQAWKKRFAEQAAQNTVTIDWGKVHEILCDIWNRCISADDGFDAIQDLIDAAPIVSVKQESAKQDDLSIDELCDIGEEFGFGTDMDEAAGYENNMLWYDVNPLPAFRAVITKLREKEKK